MRHKILLCVNYIQTCSIYCFPLTLASCFWKIFFPSFLLLTISPLLQFDSMKQFNFLKVQACRFVVGFFFLYFSFSSLFSHKIHLLLFSLLSMTKKSFVMSFHSATLIQCTFRYMEIKCGFKHTGKKQYCKKICETMGWLWEMKYVCLQCGTVALGRLLSVFWDLFS